jgi:hypothetical protein
VVRQFHFITLFGYLSLTTLLGKKRSADEADVATREDGAKRRENTGSTKKRERCTQSTRFKFAWTTLTGRGPVATQAGAIPASDFKAHAVQLHVIMTHTPLLPETRTARLQLLSTTQTYSARLRYNFARSRRGATGGRVASASLSISSTPQAARKEGSGDVNVRVLDMVELSPHT